MNEILDSIDIKSAIIQEKRKDKFKKKRIRNNTEIGLFSFVYLIYFT